MNDYRILQTLGDHGPEGTPLGYWANDLRITVLELIKRGLATVEDSHVKITGEGLDVLVKIRGF